MFTGELSRDQLDVTPAEHVTYAIERFEEAKSGLFSAMEGVETVRGRRISPARPEAGCVEAQIKERLEDWKAARAVLEAAIAHMQVAQSLVDFVLVREVEPLLQEHPESLPLIQLN